MQSIIVFSSLYPNIYNPVHGIFVKELNNNLSKLYEITMIAPINGRSIIKSNPAFLLRSLTFSHEQRQPIFWNIPKYLKKYDAQLMAFFCRKTLARCLVNSPKLIHAHYAYPDGAAAAHLARLAGIPYIITVHGSDINILAQTTSRLPIIKETLNNAAAVVAVSDTLADKVKDIGVPGQKVHTIPNGVDLNKFTLRDKEQAKASLNLRHDKTILLAVGRLDAIKGFDKLIQSMALLDTSFSLLIVGSGPEHHVLDRLIRSLHLTNRVQLVGPIPHENLSDYYTAADLLVISSYSEGWPTVIFEAAACGTTIAATAVGGIPEIFSKFELGQLIQDNSPPILAEGILKTFSNLKTPDTLHNIAQEHSWNRIALQYQTLYQSICE